MTEATSGPADAHPRDDDLPDPLLPEQPADAERPVPMRAAPERAADPSEWATAGAERLQGRQPHAPHTLPKDAGRDLRQESPDWAEGEAAYSTELQQGAVHPLVPDGTDVQDGDVSEADPDAQLREGDDSSDAAP